MFHTKNRILFIVIMIFILCCLVGCGATSEDVEELAETEPFVINYAEIDEAFTNIAMPGYSPYLVQGTYLSTLPSSALNSLVSLNSLYGSNYPEEYKIPALEETYDLEWGFYHNIIFTGNDFFRFSHKTWVFICVNNSWT